MTTIEVARYLGVSKNTVLRWVESGKLPPEYRLPSGYNRFNRDMVESFKEEMRKKATDVP